MSQITRFIDEFAVLCDGVRYTLRAERMTKAEHRAFLDAMAPHAERSDEILNEWAAAQAEADAAKAAGTAAPPRKLPTLSAVLDGSVDVTVPVIRERGVSVDVVDGEQRASLDCRANRDLVDEFLDANVPDNVITRWGALMREAKRGNGIARAGSPDSPAP